ncbi:hypothetical protein SNE40_021879 [Patella caerulea]|uniref:Uncharacterized protein n=1 Tax=Patella caerulea TaxID=87958 RepID=A0AAN8G0Z6_PATCE
MRNFSRCFIDGLTGKALKADTIRKHMVCEPHLRSKTHDINSWNKHQKSKTNFMSKFFETSEKSERERVAKLFELAYALASEEIAFSKFETFANLEKRHGVTLGNIYINQIKCQQFTNIIGEDLKQQLIFEIDQCEYFTVLMDGSTDVSAIEKEVIYTLFINKKGERQTKFFRLKNATAVGIRDCLMEALQEMRVTDLDKKLIGFMADGASVNLGTRRGVAALLKEEFDWLIVIHCLNHRLELAAKDSFNDTHFLDIISMLNSLHSMYQHSPRKIRELKELGEIMNETVTKPEKAMGTRWLQHKRSACQSLIQSYPVIINHMENMIEDTSSNIKKEDKQKYKGYLTKLKSLNFVLYLLYFAKILTPLAKLSLAVQGDSIDLLYALSCLETFYSVLQEDNIDDASELGYLVQDVNGDNLLFKGVELYKGATSVHSFLTHIQTIKTKIESCVKNRFADLESNEVFKVLSLINTSMWPTTKSELDKFGNIEIQTFISHFRTILEKKQCRD